MEDIARENGPVENSSFATEAEYSIISRTQGNNSIFANHCSSQIPGFESSSPNELSSNESEHLYMSHHALATAYDHLKIKYKDLELVNRSLQKRVTVASKLGGNGMMSNSTANSHENSITQAWDAYTDKLRECEKLRDELREVQQKLTKSEDAVKDQSLRSDIIRAQAMHDDLKKSLQESELKINDLKHKEEMAREELQKEKEYQEQVLRSAEQHHNKMQSEISDLQTEVQEKNRQIDVLLKDQEKHKKLAQARLTEQEEKFKIKILELEDRVMREQEERVRLAEEMKTQQEEMKNFHNSTGLPMNLSLHQKMLEEHESENGSACSDIDALELVQELQSLTEELNTLKKQASIQSSILNRITEDPRVLESLSNSINSFSVDTFQNHTDSSLREFTQVVPVQCTEIQPGETGSTNPSLDTRQIVDGHQESNYDFPSHSTASGGDIGSTTNDLGIIQRSKLGISRQIHSSSNPESVSTKERDTLQHRIEIPRDPKKLDNAFNNIRLATSGASSNSAEAVLHQVNETNENQQDSMTTYYTTTPDTDDGHASVISARSLNRRDKISQSASDDGSSSDATTVVSDVIGGNSVVMSPEEGVVVRYPPTLGNTNNSGESPADMAAVWPSVAKRKISGTSPWPPSSSSGSSRFTPSFEVIPGQPSTSNYDVTSVNSVDPAVSREYEVQPVYRVGRHPTEAALPPSHPTKRPSSRARGSLSDIPTSSFERNDHQRRSMDSIEVLSHTSQTDDERAFMSNLLHQCPVCEEPFSADASQHSMQRHINAHFSDDDDIPTLYYD